MSQVIASAPFPRTPCPLPLPARFAWLRHLDAAGVAAFFRELLEARELNL